MRESEAPNPRGLLLPGMYAQVKFTLARSGTALLIPGDALVLGRGGPRVAVVGGDGRVHFHAIHIAQDLGAELAVDSGLSEGDQVVLNPTDEVRDGAVVSKK